MTSSSEANGGSAHSPSQRYGMALLSTVVRLLSTPGRSPDVRCSLDLYLCVAGGLVGDQVCDMGRCRFPVAVAGIRRSGSSTRAACSIFGRFRARVINTCVSIENVGEMVAQCQNGVPPEYLGLGWDVVALSRISDRLVDPNALLSEGELKSGTSWSLTIGTP